MTVPATGTSGSCLSGRTRLGANYRAAWTHSSLTHNHLEQPHESQSRFDHARLRDPVRLGADQGQAIDEPPGTEVTGQPDGCGSPCRRSGLVTSRTRYRATRAGWPTAL